MQCWPLLVFLGYDLSCSVSSAVFLLVRTTASYLSLGASYNGSYAIRRSAYNDMQMPGGRLPSHRCYAVMQLP